MGKDKGTVFKQMFPAGGGNIGYVQICCNPDTVFKFDNITPVEVIISFINYSVNIPVIVCWAKPYSRE
jgi:hypothetical protein